MTSKMLIKHSKAVLLIRQTGVGVFMYCGGRRGQIEGKWSKMQAEPVLSSWDREDFALMLQKNDVKWSDNALTKPVIQARPLWTEKYRCPIIWDNSMH